MNYQFLTSRELDKEAGIYFYRARYYDATIGRFLSEDPIGFQAGVNFYVYVKNNPVNWIDPWGLDGLWSCNKYTWTSPWKTVSTDEQVIGYEFVDGYFEGHFLGVLKCFWREKLRVNKITERQKYIKVECTNKCTGDIRESEQSSTSTSRSSENKLGEMKYTGTDTVGFPIVDADSTCKSGYRPGG